ncbi:sugar transferase [Lewinella sp. LCG006]|uniref:sugar transferase n=1 Tax=Lewinella sp. LCG006 TaxID=3231911 RepID=UPI0034613FF3
MYKNLVKPALDMMIGIIALILLSPVMLVVGIMLAVANGGSPLFFQQRPGKDGKLFRLVKFKTMTDKKNATGQLLPDKDRITKIGGLVRKTSLDELPQLVNVVKGDMSIVGPRPLLVQYLELYNDFQHQRHLVRPGITGWAQINGRNAVSWEERFELDVWYVNHISFRLDLVILFKTVGKIWKQEGINAQPGATMTVFTGTKEQNQLTKNN